MLFLVDGYNVTRSDPNAKGLSLEAQRNALVARLRSRGSKLLGAGRIVVLFDGEQGFPVGSSDPAPVRIVFSRAGSADDAIVQLVQGTGEKVVVVSNDRGLLDRVRVHARGEVESRPASALYEQASGPRKLSGKRGGVARDVGLPKGANRITQELKDLWLNEDE